MTTKPLPTQPAARRLPPLPDPPQKGDMQEHAHFEMLGEGATLGLHFNAYPRRAGSTTLIAGKGYLCRHRSDLQRPGLAPYPDLLVAFDVNPRAITSNNGYDISEIGKPPALALEIASSSTGKNDYIGKRTTYANLGVQEYWRFDHTGGQYHDVPIAGDRLTPEGVYQPIELQTEPDGVIWGYSEVLQLSLCWVPGEVEARLRFWNPANESYIPDQEEERDGRIAAQERATVAEPQPTRHRRRGTRYRRRNPRCRRRNPSRNRARSPHRRRNPSRRRARSPHRRRSPHPPPGARTPPPPKPLAATPPNPTREAANDHQTTANATGRPPPPAPTRSAPER